MQYNAEADITAIINATKGIGTREKELIAVICNRTEPQLQALRAAFAESQKGKDLIKLIRSETTGLVEKAFEYILSSSAEVRAMFLQDAVKGSGTDEGCLIDALCTATPSEVNATREAYNKESVIKFDTRVKLETAGDMQAILEANLSPTRPESGVDLSKMEDDVATFLKKTEGQTGTDIRYLAKLIATRSREHLNALHFAVAKVHKNGKTAGKIIMEECSGNIEFALLANFLPAGEWFSFRIHSSAVLPGTKEDKFLRGIFLPSPAQLKDADKGLAKDKETVAGLVQSELAGDLRDVVLAYVKFNLAN